MKRRRIIAVDDNEIIQKLIYASLKDEFDVTIVGNSNELFEVVAKINPELILLDIMLPDDSGYEICTKLKSDKRFENIPVIFLSSKTGSVARSTGYNLGAINYIEKPFQISELRSIIISTLKNKSISEDIIQISNLEIDLLKGIVFCEGEHVVMTSSEFKLLVHFVKNINKVFSREELVNVVSPFNNEVTTRIIDNFISSLRKKIEKTSLQFKTVYGSGYKMINNS